MSSTRPRDGHCPACEEQIPEEAVLIEYETEEDRRRFAECPGCDEVVHPV
jgi:NAD-dependent SIR2 family protein deacetylase